MGFDDGLIPEPFNTVYADMMKVATELMHAKAEVKMIDEVQFKGKQLVVNGVPFHLEQPIFQMVKKATGIAFFICTIGHHLSEKIKELLDQGLQLEAYILDLIVSDAVDLAMDIVQNDLKDHLSLKGLKTTNRCSPGYCDWDVKEQKKLFEILPGRFTNVKLTDTCVMYPLKTISGIIGIGSNVRFNNYSCEVCRRKNCVYSRRKMSSTV